MTYKSNYEPYVSRSFHVQEDPGSPAYDEAIDPLRSLYPYVTALQRQSDPGYFLGAGYNPSYWAEAYTTQPPLEESPKRSLRRLSDISGRRFVSRLRRFLGRDDEPRRRPLSTSVVSKKGL